MISSVTPLTTASQPTASTASSGNSSGTSTGNASIASTTNGLLDPNQFLSLLVDSLKYQNPLNPTSSAQFLSQLAALSQVQSEQQISQTQQVAAATSLIGQVVSGSDLNGVPVSGTATGFSITPNGPTINVGNNTISLGSIDAVGTTPVATSPTQSTTQSSSSTPSSTGA
ncbi:MAG: hypothetical protein M1374_04780 [Firmicutes bacterium]|jgi:flagellar basal-body rod modification protein FlgD|nr:hypothetical protein [Bacillota bacterium]